MNLFIEKEFLISFFNLYEGEEKEKREGYLKLLEVFTSFSDLNIFLNEDIEELISELPHSKILLNYNKDFTYLPEETFSESIMEYDHFFPAIAFTSNSHDWCMKFTGGSIKVCNIETFEISLSEIESLDRNFSLSKPKGHKFAFNGWEDLSYLSDFSMGLKIVDLYILAVDKSFKDDSFKFDLNIIPMIKSLNGRYSKNKVKIYSGLKDLSDKEILNILVRLSDNGTRGNVEIIRTRKIISSEIMRIHDRYCYGSFFIISCPKGFNIFNKKGNVTKTNSNILVKSVLNEFWYSEWRAGMGALEDYYKRKTMEREDKPQIIYPS